MVIYIQPASQPASQGSIDLIHRVITYLKGAQESLPEPLASRAEDELMNLPDATAALDLCVGEQAGLEKPGDPMD